LQSIHLQEATESAAKSEIRNRRIDLKKPEGGILRGLLGAKTFSSGI
jgi:hypothetical protein